jgi:DNA topoisomerase-2
MPKKASQKSLSESSVLESEKTEYSALEPHEHVLKRPSMYIGGIVPVKMDFYSTSNVDEGIKIVKKEGMINQGLHRIFVEILSNAIDNVWRSLDSSTPCTSIKVDIIRETGEISIWNNGKTIPIEINPETRLYNPEMLFGRLLSGSNFNDDEERKSSGTNGLGSVVCNIFSTAFEVDIFDNHTLKKYLQTWSENMKNVGKPKITTPKTKAGYVKITFLPDFEKFGCTGLSDDMYSLFYKNVVDTAMLTGVNVFFNGTKIPMKTLKDYASLYVSPIAPIVQPEEKKEDDEEDEDDTVSVVSTASKKCRKKQLDQIHIISDDSECVLQPNPNISDGFQAISFVNGIETRDGGAHVDTYAEAIFRPLLEALNKGVKKGSTPLGLKEIKPYFQMFLKSTLDKPAFNSQEKSKLVSPAPAVPEVATKHINAILKWGCVDKIKNLLKGKELVALKKTEKKRGFVKIEGYDPANLAGGKNSKECTLILCEGLSARSFCIKGLSDGVVNGKKSRDYIGCYSLKGKPLNVRNANVSQISNNKEICGIIQALNLKYGIDYTKDENFNTLSYGHVTLVCDADLDASHIMGLIISFFHKLFPSLLERKASFITSMRTPVVRLYQKEKELQCFYTLDDFKKYCSSHVLPKGVESFYYKGLGTNKDKEIKSCFGKKMVNFNKDDKADETIDKVFLTKNSDKRKTWLSNWDPTQENLHIGRDPVQELSISEFLDKEMICYSIADCQRSLPCMVDSLKTSQRKILYAFFLKNVTKDVKVAQISAYTAQVSEYHHGEDNLNQTIIKMAQQYVGSNNISLLYPSGQFGSRVSNGADAASARYIFTRLNRFTRLLYPKEDDVLLDYQIEDKEVIEPKMYVPILPQILVNGALGIGTAFSSSVPMYNPRDIVRCVHIWIENPEAFECPELIPWYDGFLGSIEKVSENKFVSKGIISRKGDVVTVNEIPIGMSIDEFKDKLDDLMEAKKIKSYKNYSTDVIVKFDIKENKEDEELTLETLKLTSSISTTNMVMFDETGKIKKYNSVGEIIDSFCKVRYEFYTKRKAHLIKTIENELVVLSNKYRFLEEVMSDTLVIKDVDEQQIIDTMKKGKYHIVDGDESFGYLLGMHIRSFSKQRLEEIKKNIEKFNTELVLIKKKTEKEMWKNDLSDFMKEYEKKI